MNFPEANRNITSITGLKFTQVLGENLAVYLGKINTLDEYGFRYSPALGTNRPGVHVLQKIISTNIVKSCGVVAVCVGKNYSIQPFNVFTQHLLPEIRAGVNNEALPVNLQVN
jgi:hypothetical protein